VSLDHGCGAHSETDLPDQGPEWPVTPSRMDDSALEPLRNLVLSRAETAALDKPIYAICEQDCYPCEPSFPKQNAINMRTYLAECGLGLA